MHGLASILVTLTTKVHLARTRNGLYIIDNFDNWFALKCIFKIYIFDLIHLLKMYMVIIIYITFYPSNTYYIHAYTLFGQIKPVLRQV